MATESPESPELNVDGSEPTAPPAETTAASEEPAVAPAPPAETTAASEEPAVAPAPPKPTAAPGKPKVGAPKGSRPAARKSGFSVRNLILFGGLVALLLAAFGVLGNHDQGGPNNLPKWKLNEPVDVELTLVTSDATDLGCAMEGESQGFHCGFGATNAKHSLAGTSRDDAKLLQPYATTTHQNLLAAGVWMQDETRDAVALDALVKSLPNPRFSMKCKFTPRAQSKATKVQWKPGTDWGAGDGWYVGEVKECKLAK